MDANATSIFLMEIRTQALMSVNAINALSVVHRRMRENRELDRGIMHSEHFRTIHSLLTHLSNTSRLIWPPSFFKKDCYCGKPKANGLTCKHCLARARAEIVQRELGVVDVEHVLKDRTLRDHLEHFDERLDAWQLNSVRRNLVQDFIGPKGAFKGLEETDMMRQFDPGTGVFTFRGEDFSLVKLAEGAQDIVGRAEDALRKAGHPLFR